MLGNLGQMALGLAIWSAPGLIRHSLRLSLRLAAPTISTVLDQRLSLGLLALRRRQVPGRATAWPTWCAAPLPARTTHRCSRRAAPWLWRRRVPAIGRCLGPGAGGGTPARNLLRRVVPVLAAPALAFKRHLPACDGVLLALAVRCASAAAAVGLGRGSHGARRHHRGCRRNAPAIVRARADAPAQTPPAALGKTPPAPTPTPCCSGRGARTGARQQTLDDAEAALGETARGALQTLVPPPDAVEPRADNGPLVAFVEAAAVDLQAASADPWPAAHVCLVRDAAGVRLLDLGDAAAPPRSRALGAGPARTAVPGAQELADAGRADARPAYGIHCTSRTTRAWAGFRTARRSAINPPLALPMATPCGRARPGGGGARRRARRRSGGAAAARPPAAGRTPDFGAAPPACAAGHWRRFASAVAELSAVAAR